MRGKGSTNELRDIGNVDVDLGKELINFLKNSVDADLGNELILATLKCLREVFIVDLSDEKNKSEPQENDHDETQIDQGSSDSEWDAESVRSLTSQLLGGSASE